MANTKASDTPYIRYIDDITILTNVGEEVELPNPVVAQMGNGSVSMQRVNWENKPVDVTEEKELIFVGRVSGYVPDVLCSVQVGRQTDNPQSMFPHCIDQFGLPKKDIQTADVMAIDDYQYFKAKIPRTLAEDLLLKQLRERVADQVILARDINHIRNAVVEIEKYLWIVQDQIDELFDRVGELEDRVDWIEENMVIDGLNIGSGTGIFSEKKDRVLEFKSILGSGIKITEDEEEILLHVDIPDGQGTQCGKRAKAKSFLTCHEKDHFPAELADGMLAFSEYVNFQMIKVVNDSTIEGASPYFFSLFASFGIGFNSPINAGGWEGLPTKPPSHNTKSSIGAGRFLKSNRAIMFEMKTGEGSYTGMIIDKDGGRFYNETSSLMQKEIYEPIDIYSQDVSKELRPARYEYNADDDYALVDKDE